MSVAIVRPGAFARRDARRGVAAPFHRIFERARPAVHAGDFLAERRRGLAERRFRQYRRCDAAGGSARLARRPGLVRPAPIPARSAGRRCDALDPRSRPAIGAADQAFRALPAGRKRGAADAHRLSAGAAWRAFRRGRRPRAKAGRSGRHAARRRDHGADRRNSRAIPAGAHPSSFRADPARRPDPVGDDRRHRSATLLAGGGRGGSGGPVAVDQYREPDLYSGRDRRLRPGLRRARGAVPRRAFRIWPLAGGFLADRFCRDDRAFPLFRRRLRRLLDGASLCDFLRSGGPVRARGAVPPSDPARRCAWPPARSAAPSCLA